MFLLTPPITTSSNPKPTQIPPSASTCDYLVSLSGDHPPIRSTPIRSTEDLCHALSLYPELANTVVGFWNGEPRLQYDLDRALLAIKGVFQAGSGAPYFRICQKCLDRDSSDKVCEILHAAVSLFRDGPTTFALRQVMKFCASTFVYVAEMQSHYFIAGGCPDSRNCEHHQVVDYGCVWLGIALCENLRLAETQDFLDIFHLDDVAHFRNIELNYYNIVYTSGFGEVYGIFGMHKIGDFIGRLAVTALEHRWGIPWEAGMLIDWRELHRINWTMTPNRLLAFRELQRPTSAAFPFGWMNEPIPPAGGHGHAWVT